MLFNKLTPAPRRRRGLQAMMMSGYLSVCLSVCLSVASRTYVRLPNQSTWKFRTMLGPW